MPLEKPWNDWYHCNGNTYGTWLPGDPRGFRERRHRRHVNGDYKNPPSPGAHADRLDRSRRLMRKQAVYLNPGQRQVAARALVEKLQADKVEVIALAIDDHHFHLLARFRDHRPKHWVGRAKMHASMLLRDVGLPGRVWAAGCRTLPIRDRPHQVNTFDYIIKHRQQNAIVWTFRDAAPKSQKPIASQEPVSSREAVSSQEPVSLQKPVANPMPARPTKARGKPATGTDAGGIDSSS